MRRGVFCGWLGVAVLLGGCGQGPVEEPRGAAPAMSDYQSGGGGSVGSARQTQADLLNRIRQSDPQFQVIERAIFNERNELGIVLDRGVDLDSVPGLMRSLLTQMAREFPGQDLTVIAYAPTDPPMRMGVARLDARTRQMTYTRDQPRGF